MFFTKIKRILFFPIAIALITGYLKGLIQSKSKYLYPKFYYKSILDFVFSLIIFAVLYVVLFFVVKIIKKYKNVFLIIFLFIIYFLAFIYSCVISNLPYYYSSTDDFNNYLIIDNIDIKENIEHHFPKKENLEKYEKNYYYYYQNEVVVSVDCEISIKIKYDDDYITNKNELSNLYVEFLHDYIIEIYDYIGFNGHRIEMFIIFDDYNKTIEYYFRNTI